MARKASERAALAGGGGRSRVPERRGRGNATLSIRSAGTIL